MKVVILVFLILLILSLHDAKSLSSLESLEAVVSRLSDAYTCFICSFNDDSIVIGGLTHAEQLTSMLKFFELSLFSFLQSLLARGSKLKRRALPGSFFKSRSLISRVLRAVSDTGGGVLLVAGTSTSQASSYVLITLAS